MIWIKATFELEQHVTLFDYKSNLGYILTHSGLVR